jgi:hypothetical protein
MMTVTKRMTKGMDATGILLAVLMSGAWALLAFDLYGIVSSGPLLGGESRYSRGWELLWAYVLAFAVWVFLGLFFYRLHLPGGWWVYLAAAASTFGAFFLMGEGESRWPAAIPLLLPVLLMGAALSAHWAALRIPLMVVSGIPCVLAAGTFGLSAIRDLRWETAAQAETRQQNMAQVATIGEDQPLWHWLPLLKEESGVRDETLAALRKLKRRQSDVEAMLAGEGYEALELMPFLDLEPTPRLQQLLNAYCLKTADYARTKPGGGDTILERTFLYTPLPALHWVRANGGDCREGISQLKAAALEYRDTKIRAKYIKELDGL